jgi:hypothetical protein
MGLDLSRLPWLQFGRPIPSTPSKIMAMEGSRRIQQGGNKEWSVGCQPPFSAMESHYRALGRHAILSKGREGPGGAAWPVDEVVIPIQVVYPVRTVRIEPSME